MRRKLIVIVTAIAAAILVIVYLAGYIRSTKYFVQGTVLADTDLSGKSLAGGQEALTDRLGAYRLEIVGRDGTETITADEIHMVYVDLQETLADLLDSQDNKFWFLDEPETEGLSLEVAYDEQELQNAISELDCMNLVGTEPEDAYVEYEDGNCRIVPEKLGNILEKEKAKEHIEEAVMLLKTQVSLEEDYLPPAYTTESEEIQSQAGQVNKMLSTELTITNGRKTEVIDKEVVKDFIYLVEDYGVELDSEKIRVYVNQHFDPAFDTVGRERTVRDALGETVTMSGGNYGTLIDTLGEVDQLIKEIKAGKKLTREPVCKTTDAASDDENDGVGDTFVEVCLSQQTLWLVESGEVVFTSPVVTGSVATNHQTPTGFYYVSFKTTEYLMQEYNSFVHYWMPYDQVEGIGFHDATWRSSFGSNIYLRSGSHGCVNMPLDSARQLYEKIDAGIPVIIRD